MRTLIIRALSTVSSILTGFLFAASAFAGNYGLDETAKKAFGDEIITKGNLPSQLGRVINGGLAVIGIIFLILAIYGGFRILLSSGNTENVKKGRDTLIYAIIGMIVITLAYAITSFVFTQILGV